MESRAAIERRGTLAIREPPRVGEAARGSGATVRSATTFAGVETEGWDGDEAAGAGTREAVSAGTAGRSRDCPIGEIANATTIAETPATALAMGRTRIA